MPFSKILLTQASKADKILIGIGYGAAMLTGLGLPSFVFLFGNIINSFGPNEKDVLSVIRPISIQFACIGVAIWILTYVYYTFLIVVSEKIGKKTKVAYLKSILQ